ncbi:hypothetical protein ABPG77_000983 [Micractinium sp. CCAP 211/92]
MGSSHLSKAAVVSGNISGRAGLEAAAPGAVEAPFEPLAVPPKLVPSLATEKSLRQLLRKYCMTTDGKKKELLDRYSKLRLAVELANDKQERTTYKQLAKRVAAQERQMAAVDLDSMSDPAAIILTGCGYRELITVTRQRDAVRRRLRQQAAAQAATERVQQQGAGVHQRQFLGLDEAGGWSQQRAQLGQDDDDDAWGGGQPLSQHLRSGSEQQRRERQLGPVVAGTTEQQQKQHPPNSGGDLAAGECKMATIATSRIQVASSATAATAAKRAAPLAAPRQTNPLRSAGSLRIAAARVAAAVQAVAAPPAPTADAARPAALVNQEKSLQKPTAIITGASSGLGLNAANALAQSGDWHVIMACRDFAKAEKAAQRLGMPKGSYTVMHLDLASLESVRQFVQNFKNSGRRLDALVANAAVYLPTAKEPTFTADGFELSVGTNHLGHFLLVNLLLEDLKESPKNNPAGAPRCIIVGSITGNTNTLAGNIPPKADLGDLRGLTTGLDGRNSSMVNGGDFDGAKAYKDSKVCNMLTMRQLHQRFHESTGVTFASLYPGCIAETGLFRNHVGLFRTLFPPFQKFVTKGYVSEAEAGRRLAQVVSDPTLDKSGVYWSWDNDKSSLWFDTVDGALENRVSEEVSDDKKGAKLWDLSMKLVGLA